MRKGLVVKKELPQNVTLYLLLLSFLLLLFLKADFTDLDTGSHVELDFGRGDGVTCVVTIKASTLLVLPHLNHDALVIFS